MNLPNLISLARLFAVPLAVWLILKARLDLAFWLFVAAGVSDALDGFLARRLDARSQLGAYLDPLADKALLVSVFIALGYVGAIDNWLVILVVSRDIMIIGGFVLLVLMSDPLEAKPSLFSKFNTVAQIVFAAVVLAYSGFNLGNQMLIDGLAYVVGATTLLSGGGYVITWVRHVARMEDAR